MNSASGPGAVSVPPAAAIGSTESGSAGRMTLSIVAPCFNEAAVLHEFHRRIISACEAAQVRDYEVILVDDGSTDATWATIEDLARTDPRVFGIRLSRNYGHQLALSAGLEATRGERTLVIDADLQDPPELLPEMMRAMDDGAEVVYGRRLRREGETRVKRATAKLFYRLLNRMTEVPIPRDVGDFRLITRRVVSLLNSMPERHRFIRGMIAWVGLQQVAIPYVRERRYAGTTKYHMRRMIRFAADAVTAFSYAPLSASAYLSAYLMLLTLILVLYVLYAWLFLEVVQGWTSILLIGDAIFLGAAVFLGLLGKYIERIYAQVSNRPLDVIEQSTSRSQISGS